MEFNDAIEQMRGIVENESANGLPLVASQTSEHDLLDPAIANLRKLNSWMGVEGTNQNPTPLANYAQEIKEGGAFVIYRRPLINLIGNTAAVSGYCAFLWLPPVAERVFIGKVWNRSTLQLTTSGLRKGGYLKKGPNDKFNGDMINEEVLKNDQLRGGSWVLRSLANLDIQSVGQNILWEINDWNNSPTTWFNTHSSSNQA